MQVLYSPVSPFSTGEKTHCFVSLLAFASFSNSPYPFHSSTPLPYDSRTIQTKREEEGKGRGEGEKERETREGFSREG